MTSEERIIALLTLLSELKKIKDDIKKEPEKKDEEKSSKGEPPTMTEEKDEWDGFEVEEADDFDFFSFETAFHILKKDYEEFASDSELLGIRELSWPRGLVLFIEDGELKFGYSANRVIDEYTISDIGEAYSLDTDDLMYGSWILLHK